MSTATTTNNQKKDLPPLVFIHGWKASILVDKDSGDEKFAYEFSQIMFGTGGDHLLDLPMEWEDSSTTTTNNSKQQQARDNLVPSKPTTYVRCACGTITLAKLYGPLLDHLQCHQGRDVRPFVYDWRRELGETVQQLELFLEEIQNETHQTPQVIAHSMGCLLTLHLVNHRPDLFHSILMGAGAMSPNFSLVEDLSMVGGMNAIVNNTKLFTPYQHLTNPGPLHMLLSSPEERSLFGCEHTVQVYDSKGQPWGKSSSSSSSPNLNQLETWKTLGIGMYHPDSGVQVTPAKEIWFQSVLDRCRTFRKGLIPTKPESEYPPIAVLHSDGHPTKFAFQLDPNGKVDFGRKATSDDSSSPQMMLPGDGRVMYQDSIPPKGIPVVKRITNKEEHSVVLNDLPAVDELLETLLREAAATR